MDRPARHRGAIAAAIAGMMGPFRRRGEPISMHTAGGMQGKTVLVTGGNRGLGLGIAKQLGARGARVVLACRSGGAEAAQQVLQASEGTAEIELFHVDLAVPSSVAKLARKLDKAGIVVDVVILNAGVVTGGSRQTKSGLDVMFHVNFLSNVQLVDALLEHDVLIPGVQVPPRVIVVGSEEHQRAAPIEFRSFGKARNYGVGQSLGEYAHSKLLLATWVEELSRRWNREDGPEISVHHLCPGAVDSSIAREAPSWSQPLLRMMFRSFFQSPDEAALPVVWLASSPEIEGRTGIYLHMQRHAESSPMARDRVTGARLWEESHTLLARIS